MTPRHKPIILTVTIATILILALSWAVPWYTDGRFEIRTDNAYVRGHISSLAARVPGQVQTVAVDDNTPVAMGDILFTIDQSDYQARVAQAEAGVQSAIAAQADLEAQRSLQSALIERAEANLQAARIGADLARKTYQRSDTLAQHGTITQARFDEAAAGRDQSVAAVSAAEAAVVAEQRSLDLLASKEGSVTAALANAEAALSLAQINLDHTVVRAPIAGIVGNRQVQSGQFVGAGAVQLDIVPLDDLWIEANFKETRVGKIYQGLHVNVTIDGFPGRTLSGVIDSVSPGSGAAFSLIAPDNATGNYVRIVQRVPVKVRLTDVPDDIRLIPGMSARVAIDSRGGDDETLAGDPS